MHVSQALHVSLCVCQPLSLPQSVVQHTFWEEGPLWLRVLVFWLLALNSRKSWSICSRDIHPMVAQEPRTCAQGRTSSSWVLPPSCYCSPKYQEVTTITSHFSEVIWYQDTSLCGIVKIQTTHFNLGNNPLSGGSGHWSQSYANYFICETLKIF